MAAAVGLRSIFPTRRDAMPSERDAPAVAVCHPTATRAATWLRARRRRGVGRGQVAVRRSIEAEAATLLSPPRLVVARRGGRSMARARSGDACTGEGSPARRSLTRWFPTRNHRIARLYPTNLPSSVEYREGGDLTLSPPAGKIIWGRENSSACAGRNGKSSEALCLLRHQPAGPRISRRGKKRRAGRATAPCPVISEPPSLAWQAPIERPTAPTNRTCGRNYFSPFFPSSIDKKNHRTRMNTRGDGGSRSGL